MQKLCSYCYIYKVYVLWYIYVYIQYILCSVIMTYIIYYYYIKYYSISFYCQINYDISCVILEVQVPD